jgi:hypothetical protein
VGSILAWRAWLRRTIQKDQARNCDGDSTMIHRLENSKSLFITVSVVFIVQYTPIFFFMIFLSQMLDEGIKLFLLWLFPIFDIINNGVFENMVGIVF